MQAHLERHALRPPSPLAAWATLLALPLLLLLAWSAEGWQGALVWVLVVVVVITPAVLRVRRMRRLERAVGMAQELALRRRAVESLRLAWRLLPQVSRLPELHGRAVAVITHNLDQVRAAEAAGAGYAYLLDHLPPEHPAVRQLQAQRALTYIACDRLADADDALRRLRSSSGGAGGSGASVDAPAADPLSGGPGAPAAGAGADPARALVGLATLVQDIRTRHFAEAADRGEGLVAELRALGVDAGYGYALVALACWCLAQREGEDAATRRAQALAWWRRATLLLPPAALVYRYPDLQPLGGDPELAAAASSAAPPEEARP